MKTNPLVTTAAMLVCAAQAWSAPSNFTNFIRQVQYPSGTIQNMDVDSSGSRDSELAIDPGGARFELWTVKSEGPTNYLLASTYVGTYIPVASLEIISEDTTSALARTRADRPFSVSVSVSGLRSGETDPLASKSVDFLWHVQSYGAGGAGEGLDRAQATLLSNTSLTSNQTQLLEFTLNSVPGDDFGNDRSKVRGEERFSLYSLEDYQAPASELDSETIQIWPVADGNIAGITSGQLVRYAVPQLTVTINDMYPFSTTYVQAYAGSAQLGVEGKILQGSALVLDESAPQDRVLIVNDYGDDLGADGVWTIELVTKTPFGIDRLHYVTFDLDRTMKVNGAFTTIE